MNGREPVRQSVLVWLPVVMIAVAVVFEMLTPPEYAASPLLAAACVVAGAILKLGRAVVVVAVALAVGLAVGIGQDRWGHVDGTAEVVDIVLAGLVAVGVNRLVARQGQRLAVARNVAEEMQRVLLPPPPRRLAGLEIAARYQAAQAEAQVGGDLYAVQETRFGVRMLVADVRGSGLAAVATVSVLVGAFREAAGHADDLTALAGRLEDALDREAEAAGAFERRFATAILAEVPSGGGPVRLVNRGHPPAYLVAEGHVDILEPADPDVPLGLRDLAPHRAPAVEVTFPAGSLLVMMTDGFTEARDAVGAFYDPREDLEVLRHPYSAHQAVDHLITEVDRWSGDTTTDDRAVLAVTRAPTFPGSAAAALRHDA